MIEDIIKNPGKYSFFQIMMVLERENYLSDEGEKQVHFRPYNQSRVVEGEVASVKPNGKSGLKDLAISPTFLGLYGPSSPLPKFYSEELNQLDQSDVPHVRKLLDTISERVYRLYYAAQHKYHPLYASSQQEESTCIEFIYGLIGLREKSLREKAIAPTKLLRLASVISQKPCSTMGMITILEDAFYPVQVKVIEGIKETIKTPHLQRFCLGARANELGVNAVIGEEIEDKRGNLRIELGPLTQAQFRSFMGEGGSWEELVFLIRFYVTQPLKIVISLVLSEGESVTTQLGSQHYGRLGLNTWTFNRQVSLSTRFDHHLNLSMNGV
jgi:type VI secretion system protein ImpH